MRLCFELLPVMWLFVLGGGCDYLFLKCVKFVSCFWQSVSVVFTFVEFLSPSNKYGVCFVGSKRLFPGIRDNARRALGGPGTTSPKSAKLFPIFQCRHRDVKKVTRWIGNSFWRASFLLLLRCLILLQHIMSRLFVSWGLFPPTQPHTGADI